MKCYGGLIERGDLLPRGAAKQEFSLDVKNGNGVLTHRWDAGPADGRQRQTASGRDA